MRILASLSLAAALTAAAGTSALAADRITGRAFATRSDVIAPHAMAATSHPLATQIALDVMKQGGSAVDAAIAANAALGLMEPTGKRVDFLKYLCGELGLTGVEFAKERAEEAARKIWREQFDVASARAVAALPVLCEYCLPLVRVSWVFIAMTGPDADAELGGSAAALKKLGGAYGDTRAFTLPDGSERRLVVCKKISQTPTAYPRNGGKIAKKPL